MRQPGSSIRTYLTDRGPIRADSGELRRATLDTKPFSTPIRKSADRFVVEHCDNHEVVDRGTPTK